MLTLALYLFSIWILVSIPATLLIGIIIGMTMEPSDEANGK